MSMVTGVDFTVIPVKDFEAAGKDPVALGVPAFWFNRTDGQKPTRSIEGFLFPDTYEFQPKGTAEDALKLIVLETRRLRLSKGTGLRSIRAGPDKLPLRRARARSEDCRSRRSTRSVGRSHRGPSSAAPPG